MRPLDGIKVVELGLHVSVPNASRLLADWGAQVIKIEAPGGDAWRRQGAMDSLPIEDECNPEFALVNSGKRLVSLDLKNPKGKEALLRIFEDTDIFMSNIRYGGLERLGLDYDTLHEQFPRLIYFHFSAFGYEGADSGRAGFDHSAFWAATGMLAEFGERGSYPTFPPGGMGDTSSANAAAAGILAALHHRDKTGEGLRLTSSLYANGLWSNFNRILACQERNDGLPPMVYPIRTVERKRPLAHIYQCADGRHLLLSVSIEKFPALLRVLGLDELVDDERFSSYAQRKKNYELLYEKLGNAFMTRPVDEWCGLLQEADIIHQKLMTSAEAGKSEQAWENDYLTRLEYPDGRSYTVPNTPITFYGAERVRTSDPGNFGKETRNVLLEYGYSAEEIENMIETGAAVAR